MCLQERVTRRANYFYLNIRTVHMGIFPTFVYEWLNLCVYTRTSQRIKKTFFYENQHVFAFITLLYQSDTSKNLPHTPF